MVLIKISFVLLVAVVACAYAQWGSGRQQGWEGQGQMSQGMNGNRGSRQSLGRQQDDQGNGKGSRQFGGEDDSRRYRANLYNDDDIYGYDAEIPAAKVFYVNYRNSDARSRRGPDFARFRSNFGNDQGSERSSGQGQGQDQRQNARNGGSRNQRASMMGRPMQNEPQW